ncbi:phosphoglucosamine mutase, partial [Mycobacteroides abscessus subsp. abscessus]|nr:phosphoglucosamine mutase [Mycobacteroides abscessus subsp. abscessus]
SHNPMPDNGIKIFGVGGHKLDDDAEAAIEAQLEALSIRPTGGGIGRVRDAVDALDRYLHHVENAGTH